MLKFYFTKWNRFISLPISLPAIGLIVLSAPVINELRLVGERVLQVAPPVLSYSNFFSQYFLRLSMVAVIPADIFFFIKRLNVIIFEKGI
jgi:hypothetical protein